MEFNKGVKPKTKKSSSALVREISGYLALLDKTLDDGVSDLDIRVSWNVADLCKESLGIRKREVIQEFNRGIPSVSL